MIALLEATRLEIPVELQGVLVANPDTLSGAVRFKGTRVAVQAWIDTLDVGGDIAEFFGWPPNVPREHAKAVIHWQQQMSRKLLGLEIFS